MLLFKCKDIGLSDRWSAQGRSDDRLLDTVAIHMREDHGMGEITPDMLARIRNAFTHSPVFHTQSSADLVLYQYNCEGDPVCTKEYIEEAELLMGGPARTLSRKPRKSKEVSKGARRMVQKKVH